MSTRLRLVSSNEAAVNPLSVARLINRRPRRIGAVVALAVAVACGAIGALCGALIEIGVWRLLA